MDRKRKTYVPLSIKLRADLSDRLDRLRAETGAPKTFTIERALDEYFSRADAARGAAQAADHA